MEISILTLQIILLHKNSMIQSRYGCIVLNYSLFIVFTVFIILYCIALLAVIVLFRLYCRIV